MPPNLEPSLVRGPGQWPNWPKPSAGPGHSKGPNGPVLYDNNESNYYRVASSNQRLIYITVEI